MGDAEIRYLKQKCNKLIDKALQLEQELEKKDLIIKQLQDKKNALDNRILEESIADKQRENIQSNAMENQQEHINNLSIENTAIEKLQNSDNQNFIVTSEKILELIRDIGEQIDNRPREEIVVRKLSVGAKIVELFYDGGAFLVKFFVLIIAMVLLSLAATILINSELRDMVFSFIKECVN